MLLLSYNSLNCACLVLCYFPDRRHLAGLLTPLTPNKAICKHLPSYIAHEEYCIIRNCAMSFTLLLFTLLVFAQCFVMLLMFIATIFAQQARCSDILNTLQVPKIAADTCSIIL